LHANRSVQKHRAGKHKYPKHISHANASARPNITERTTPHNAKALQAHEVVQQCRIRIAKHDKLNVRDKT
ncbi:hypothetical protein, partial [Mesorhizobium sp.]|uniref:hypothetical protein n=1 Tax=Mesorhizobium sp. TaxID=1871066 RepID=UPI0025F298B9